ncbi:DUF748 domain-containing protein [Algoriphagus sp.]|jgi:hypothetical protein|uniref:DUF748 domain-containing protein n=1 Tax=Algoriphagus sp. TaxID=1872435 RepID=UPI0027169BE6|nr:DUF748 domain-containing protein [Algoriphagus sp.]MDO8967610.1 DUF748 domain-containing protein [Algoriphagus sp.]MDP3198589.1 DUF748 domain-containing protein [Algoriphagus sp.]
MKFLKIFAVLVVVLLVLFGIGVYWGKSWINENLESIVNSNPDRKYDFKFDRIDVDFFGKVILINEVKITPFGELEGVYVEGKVVQVLLSQVDVLKLIMQRDLIVQNLSFSQPDFIIHIPLENNKEAKPATALQSLFGDILSRGMIRNFQLGRASARMMLGEDQIGSLNNLNIVANELSTDSLKWNYPIPFDYERILISIDSLDYIMGNGQKFKTGKIGFDTKNQQLQMNLISLKYPEGIQKASSKMDLQVDLIEFSLDSLILSGIEANSNLYSNLDIRAQKLEVLGLFLEDFRNKELPRPPNEVKSLFQGLLQKVNFPLKLDTLKVSNGAIVYGESVPGKNQTWQFHLDNLNGNFVNITTIPEFQTLFKHFDGKFTAKIEGSGNLNIDLSVPYDKDEFDMVVDFTSFRLTKINEILKPIMNGEIVSGNLVRMNIKIHADVYRSTNLFRFDYSDLKIEMYQKGSQKKSKLMSTIANIALNSNNMPGDKRYMTANYTTQRNRYRGPFHLVWSSTKQGMMTIVPGGVAKEIMGNSEK